MGNQIAVPANFSMLDELGGAVPAVGNAFFTAWVGSYTLRMDGSATLELTNQKQQAIKAPVNLESGVAVV